MSASPVSNVSDTARWVAVYRARESARPDALFHDAFADLLAGDRGRAIAALVPRQARSGWPMVTRTKLIDDLVLEAVGAGCDCVLNLAAGLDTRPYRLELPAVLSWVELDLPALTEEKERLLESAQPRCLLRRIKVDLADVAARADRVIARVMAGQGDAALFAHGHVLRILAARWICFEPTAASRLALDTATISVLGYERDTQVIRSWNLSASA